MVVAAAVSQHNTTTGTAATAVQNNTPASSFSKDADLKPLLQNDITQPIPQSNSYSVQSEGRMSLQKTVSALDYMLTVPSIQHINAVPVSHVAASTELSNIVKQEINSDITISPSSIEPKRVFSSTQTVVHSVAALLPSTSLERKTEAASIFIKKDYLPSPIKTHLPKVEKTRDEVTRILNFGSISNTDEVIEVSLKTASISAGDVDIVAQAEQPLTEAPVTITPSLSISEDKENASNKIEFQVNYLGGIKPDISDNTKAKHKDITTKNNTSADKKPSAERITSVSSTSTSAIGGVIKDYKPSSSSRRSSSSSNRECSRCYKRSKIKRFNFGVQCGTSVSSSIAQKPTAFPMRNLNCTRDGAKGLKYERFFHIEVHSNGGASVVHMYQDEIDTLSKQELDELVDEFFTVAFSEDVDGNAHHVMGIVHDAAAYLPDLLEHMSENYSTLTVKAGVMGRNSDIETSTMFQYNEQVNNSQ